jgi:tRNA pseudouridine55 synthase
VGASKAGHTGSLDPFATGLLPLVFGEATKFSRFLIDSTKAYEATLRLGHETDTGDPESPVRPTGRPIPGSQQIAPVLQTFTGELRQTPPMHSAVHVGGRRLYEYAREGREVAREAREVHVFQLEMKRLLGNELVLDVVCSKGTYIRVLAMDIGSALGCGAYLTALRRTSVGPLSLRAALPLDALMALDPATARAHLLPVHTLVADLPRLDLEIAEARRFLQGQAIAAEGLVSGAVVAAFTKGGRFLGVGAPEGERLAPLRLVAGATISPDFA